MNNDSELISKYTSVNWFLLIEKEKLTEDFIERHANEVDWRAICTYQKLSEPFMEKFKDKLDWLAISKHQILSETFIEKYTERLCWSGICSCQNISESFVEKHLEDVRWVTLSGREWSEDFFLKFKDKIYWDVALYFNCFSEEFITKLPIEFINVVDIISCQKIPEEFLDMNLPCYKSHDVYLVCEYQKLSESFMRKYKNVLDWRAICKYQKLSEDFIEEMKDMVMWDVICKYQKLSEDFIIKYKYCFSPRILEAYQKLPTSYTKDKFNWLNWTRQDKLDYIKKHYNNIYEIVDDEYIVAYKSVRKNGYSHFNFLYKYEVGKEYESQCDCDSCECDSFGLSAWTKEMAKNYVSNNRVLKVHIAIDDVGTIVNAGHKIRAKKFKVVSDETEINHV